MTLLELLDDVRKTKGMYAKEYWSRDMGKGITVCEYKLYYDFEHLGYTTKFIQIEYNTKSKEVLAATIYSTRKSGMGIII